MIIAKKCLKASLKILLIVSVLFALFCTSMLSSCSQTETSYNASDFETIINEVSGANNHLPSTEQLGTYESVFLNSKRTNYALWVINALSLHVEYNEENFEKEVAQIKAIYSFVNEEKEGLRDYSAFIYGYEILIVDKAERLESDYSYYYPKCFMMIGINKEKHSIVYMYHYDIDLDEIKDLDAFVKKYYELN